MEHGKICDAVGPLIRRFRLTNICERFYVGSCTAYGTQGLFKYDTTSKSHGQFEAYVKIVNLCVYIEKIGMSHSLHSTAKKKGAGVQFEFFNQWRLAARQTLPLAADVEWMWTMQTPLLR